MKKLFQKISKNTAIITLLFVVSLSTFFIAQAQSGSNIKQAADFMQGSLSLVNRIGSFSVGPFPSLFKGESNPCINSLSLRRNPTTTTTGIETCFSVTGGSVFQNLKVISPGYFLTTGLSRVITGTSGVDKGNYYASSGDKLVLTNDTSKANESMLVSNLAYKVAGTLTQRDQTTQRTLCADASGILIICGQAAPETYSWSTSNWVCPAATRTVSCKNSSGTVVADSFCTTTKPAVSDPTACVVVVNASCGSVNNTCSKGTFTDVADDTKFSKWQCIGSGGGTSVACSLLKNSCEALPSSSGPYAACFIADTQVSMADGSTKNIQDVNLGDVVKGQTGNNTVLGFHQPKLGDKKLYSYNGGAYFVTAEHPFMTTDGWKAFDPELAVLEHNLDIEIGQLAIGDTLITENGNVVLKTVATKSADAETQLYNFILSGDRTYYADGYLVHNKTACLVSLPNQGCGSNSTCYGTDGYANPNGTSCSLSCTTPGEILTNRCPVGTETTKTETYCGTDYQQHCRVPFVNTCTSSSCTGTYNTTTYVAPWTSTRIGINNCNEVSEDGGSAAVNCPLRSTYCHLNDTYKCNGTLSTVSNSCSTLTQLQCGTKTGCTWGPAPYIPD